jgi:hypothetical protein
VPPKQERFRFFCQLGFFTKDEFVEVCKDLKDNQQYAFPGVQRDVKWSD